MASKSRARPQRKRQPNQLANLGLFDIPNLDEMNESGDESEVDESALESELEALLSGTAPTRPSRPKQKVSPAVDIEKLANDCMKDVDDDDDDDGNLSTDEDLLNELQNITTESPGQENEPHEKFEENKPSMSMDENESVSETQQPAGPSPTASSMSTLQERLAMYNEAIQAAKINGDSSKVRRYGRAVKTLESLLKTAKSGAMINEEDIPPVVKVPKPSANTAVSNSSEKHTVDLDESTVSSITDDHNLIEGSNFKEPEEREKKSDTAQLTRPQLVARRDQYKVAAVQAKREGNKDLALNNLRTVKTFDAVIQAIDNNLPVDWSNVPPPPKGISAVIPMSSEQKVAHDQIQTSSDIERAALAAANEPQEPELFAAPPPPATVLEALQQRLEKYLSTKQTAEAENNSGKVRRLQRIIKQYEAAIKDYKAGRNVNFEELPAPPGFGPIPIAREKPAAKPSVVNPPGKVPTEPKKVPANTRNTNHAQDAASTSAEKKAKVQRTNTSTEKQLEFLLERQKLFRQAALTAKQSGHIQQAKEYLRMSKGFDSMIEATRCGLPIDASTIPTPPQLEADFVIVDVSDCTENENCSQEELYQNLEKDLCHQIEVCSRNKEHFLRLGDVSSASKFEKLCLESKKDLTVIHHLKKKGEPVPRFHYETRLFSMVQCHTDLGDNDLEVTIERGINLPGKPDDLDSYVKLEFPIPQENPQRAKTHTIRDTNNPIIQEEFKFEFNRKSRSHLRLFKRQALKLEVWSKGGFLRSDCHLGTISIKLADLESKCTIHDSFNLMDGRKTCGGKLEVKLRIRDPLLVKQVEEVREKWLVIGS